LGGCYDEDDASMSDRSRDLRDAASSQISVLIHLFSECDDAVLRRACPGRERLGDGSVAACAFHTADSYHRIAAFVGGRPDSTHARYYAAGGADLVRLVQRLSAARDELTVLADLSDEQLDEALVDNDMRFCDGRRTLEEVIRSLLKHQSRSVDALRSAVLVGA
jgi:succinylarginine dihydrolase